MKTKKSKILGDIAHARSGDKGNHSNIGVIAWTPKDYEFLKYYLTASKIKNYFKNVGVTEVIRYEMDNILALNFVLKNALAGGGGSSLRIDTQGKLFGTALLQMQIPNYKKIEKKNAVKKFNKKKVK